MSRTFPAGNAQGALSSAIGALPRDRHALDKHWRAVTHILDCRYTALMRKDKKRIVEMSRSFGYKSK